MTMADIHILNILLHGEKIGTLTLLPGDRTLFSFDESYIANPDRPTLSLSFKDVHGGLITGFRQVQTRVPPFFANLLPEGAMRDYLARLSGVNEKREFFLLWALGRDLPGALSIWPAGDDRLPMSDDEGNAENRQERRQSMLRFSLAGVQLKFSALLEARGGLTIPAQGVGGSWIVKLPSGTYEGVPENEFAMMSMARMTGMDVPEVKLVELADIANLPENISSHMRGKALAVRRFDRLDDGQAVHIEDFAQVFGVYPDDKYKKASYRNIAQVLWAESGEKCVSEFIRRLVFSTLIGNADMHLKNWSLIYRGKRKAQLSPAYDLLSTIPYLPDDMAALKYGRTKRMDGLSMDELSWIAGKAHLPERAVLDAAKETVQRFREVWSREKTNLPISKAVIEAIESHMAKIPIARDE